jgi:hypothetical protein
MQATLTDEKLTIIIPPHRCPFSGVRTYLEAKNSKISLWPMLHFRHWYNYFLMFFNLQKLGLHQRNMVHASFMVPSYLEPPPIYVALYVDDFIYFSLDDEVENYFETALSQKVTVDFLCEAEWFLRMKFDWSHQPNSNVQFQISK